ncbi:MAG: hypothetical protein OJF51_002416 [Nitrospira sp.]|jgi:FixJ family two-component response regulator|nr:MAG: hypothetical protein OJF51_002416 [Nitrospira sp.]
MRSPKKQHKIRISARQRAVLSYLAAGLTMNEIAKRLKMAPGTVAMHRRQLGLAFHPYGAHVVLLLRAAVHAGELPADVLARSADGLSI